MLSIFNRKELLATFSFEQHLRVRGILEANDIDYRIKTINRASPSPISAGTRGRTGSAGYRDGEMYEYIFYVAKADCEWAAALIR